ncbi:MAG TPA: substrate-binding domain-containing protein, partial [Rhodothermia bacterium]
SGLESDVQSSYIATNNREGGRLGARRLAALLDGKGKVIMLRLMEGSASTTEREEGFLEEIHSIAPDIEILVDNQYAGATVEKALQVSQNLLNRFDDVDGIWTANESSTQGMLRALQTAGRAGTVKFVGFDSNEVLLDGMRDGQLHGLAVQDPFEMGYAGVHTAVAVLKGESYHKLVDTGVMMITPDNIATDEAQSLLKPDLATWLN